MRSEAGPKLTLLRYARLYSQELLEQIAEHLKNLLADMLAHPEHCVSEAKMLSSEEFQRLTVDWQGAVTPYEERCMHQFFEDQVARTPDAVALRFNDKTLTYQELNIRANTLAHRLRKMGARPEVVVGIGMERSMQSAVCLLGILKSGAAYTVIDPDSPSARIKDIVSLSAAKIVITDAEHALKFSGCRAKVLTVDVLSDSPENQNFPENIYSGVTVENAAYILFTSGSTGKPKGVIGIHRSMAHLYGFGRFSYAESDICCLNTPLGFLGAIAGLLMPLCCGLPVVIIPDEQEKDPRALAGSIHKTGITNLTIAPSLLKQLSTLGTRAKNLLKTIRRVGVSGSVLDRDTINAFRKIMPQATLTVGYASTEIGSVAFGYLVNVEKAGVKNPVPLGRPGPNIRAYILDKYMNPVPVGVPGELYIAGDHIARGYAGQPELTAERFLPDIFAMIPGKRFFRTGDNLCLRFDGEVEYRGRSDNQVKVRGFRVELGEIESVLAVCPGVGEAVVVKNERGKSQRLVAYVVKKTGAELDAVKLREHMWRHLPRHMIPSAFFFLKQIPLTANGKIDRYSLSLESLERPALENEYTPPKDDFEAELIEIWQAVLGIQNIGIHDEFLEIGGESLLAAIIVEKISERFSVEIPLPLFFSNLTIASLATEILRIRAEA
jgi:amino acid adenylation domain-containing protein